MGREGGENIERKKQIPNQIEEGEMKARRKMLQQDV